MNVFDRFTRMIKGRESGKMLAQVDGRPVEFVTYMQPGREVESVGGWSIEALWRTQPHLRTVVDFVAKNVASLGLHVYTFAADGGRERVRTGPLADLMRMANQDQTGDEFIYSLAHELTLYDGAFCLFAPNNEGVMQVRVIPTSWVTVERVGSKVTGYIVNGKRVSMDQILHFPGWTPGDTVTSTSPVETLRIILDSEQATHSRRRDLLTKGPRVGGVISRPKDAPVWSDAARRTFDETWEAFQPGGERAGDAVLLEDGMTYTGPEFAADAAGYRDGNTLSLSTVAQVFTIHPSILGVPGAVGYQGVREIRRALIGDSLAWLLKRIEKRISNVLMPALGEPAEHYAEFNVDAKLRGSFEERAVIMRQSVGAPYMTVNEARSMDNMPAIDGGDVLVTPLNVTTEGGSNRSPEDDAAQQDGEALKAAVIDSFRARQSAVLAAKRGAGVTEFDWSRWMRELAEDAAKAGVELSPADVADVNLDAYSGWLS